MSKRRNVPSDIEADVIAGSRRRCCLCYALSGDDSEKRGQIAHIDHDPSNNSPDNLVFLCLHHHDQVDSTTSQSKGLTSTEVKRYRAQLLTHLSQRLPSTDAEIADRLAMLFDRPAFRTPFQHESSLPRFRSALVETIEALNTGNTPHGALPASKHHVSDPVLRQRVDDLVQGVVALRAAYDELIRTGDIRPCECNNPECPVHFLTPRAIEEMDQMRLQILRLAHGLCARLPADLYGLA